MLINLRNALMAGKRTPTAKDYVQNGLVAMWDGIENAGWGTHDASATTWVDLSGNGRHLNIDSSVANFSANSLIIQANSIGASGAQIITSPDGVTTTESVMEDVGYLYSKSNVYIFGGPWYMLTKRADNICASMSDHIGTFHVGNYRKGYDGSADLRSAKGISVTRGGRGVGDIYINGEVIASSFTSAGATYSPPSGIMIAAATYGTEYFNIRLYSRALTADEIARNYAIDNARFGLP